MNGPQERIRPGEKVFKALRTYPPWNQTVSPWMLASCNRCSEAFAVPFREGHFTELAFRFGFFKKVNCGSGKHHFGWSPKTNKITNKEIWFWQQVRTLVVYLMARRVNVLCSEGWAYKICTHDFGPLWRCLGILDSFSNTIFVNNENEHTAYQTKSKLTYNVFILFVFSPEQPTLHWFQQQIRVPIQNMFHLYRLPKGTVNRWRIEQQGMDPYPFLLSTNPKTNMSRIKEPFWETKNICNQCQPLIHPFYGVNRSERYPIWQKNNNKLIPFHLGKLRFLTPDFFSGILMGNVQLPLWLFYSQGPNMVTHQDDMTLYF